MHPALQPIEFLIGTWTSESAVGHFPTINDFKYDETIYFEEIGQPLLNFKSISKIGERPMHLESGFLRILPGTSKVAFMVSHNFGLCSVEEGSVEGCNIVLESSGIQRISFAKDPMVTKIRRTITLLEDMKLEIKTDMATTNTPELTNHLIVIYKKNSS
ncbi:CLUMA_CG002034, isoform A [Clunio marinus]|uniref:CLUMA_CG002034, isoform A n=1 Tax=Clunio marinus TaxID=568069 RepID=A0A1J1HJQ0_9DIPT|nr:CLUMA_CG002034, isoform A [Clunio marinus]